MREILNVYYSDGSFIYRQKDNALVKKLQRLGRNPIKECRFESLSDGNLDADWRARTACIVF